MATKKVKKVKKVKEVKETKVEVPVTAATKQFIYERMGKESTAEIARQCNLTEEEVIKIATSSELDIPPVEQEKGVARIRRFERYKETVQMTAAQSMLDDRERSRNAPNQDEINKQFGKDLQKIERRV